MVLSLNGISELVTRNEVFAVVAHPHEGLLLAELLMQLQQVWVCPVGASHNSAGYLLHLHPVPSAAEAEEVASASAVVLPCEEVEVAVAAHSAVGELIGDPSFHWAFLGLRRLIRDYGVVRALLHWIWMGEQLALNFERRREVEEAVV